MCPCAAIGWAKPEQDAFMREVCKGAPPPLLDLPEPEVLDLAPCGLKLRPCGASSFCSLCFDPLERGVHLSTGEILCTVCSSKTFEFADQHDASAFAAPVALLAPVDAEGRLSIYDLRELTGRAIVLLSSLRLGETLHFCGCIPSKHLRGRRAIFLGYCMRRHLALLQVGHSVACMRMDSTEDPLMIREAQDQTVLLHERMLRQLNCFASKHTLQAAVASIYAAHTLCGSELLTSAERLAKALVDEDSDDEVQVSEDADAGARKSVTDTLTHRAALSPIPGHIAMPQARGSVPARVRTH